MSASDPPHQPNVTLPEVRRQLVLSLEELGSDDPREVWRSERQQGLVSGIDQVFHFFFDDHPFDAGDLGVVFVDQEELVAVQGVKQALEAVLEAVGDEGDDEFVEHPLWPNVTRAAAIARHCLHGT